MTLKIKKIFFIMLQVFLALMLGACSILQSVQEPPKDWRWDDVGSRWLWAHASYQSEPKVSDENWLFEKAALRFRIEAPQQLNSFNSEPHTLVVRVLQMTDAAKFSSLIKTASGIRELLSKEEVDESILVTKTLTIAPNDSRNISIDRQEGARFIGIVSGYVDLKKSTATRLIPIVGVDRNKDSSLLGTVISYITFSEEEAEEVPVQPGVINLELWLGSKKIDKIVSFAE